MQSARITQENFSKFLTAGNALFTVRNAKSGSRFTFKVTKPKGTEGVHFVKVLTGSDNENDYSHLGTIFGSTSYRHGKKSPLKADAPSAIAFDWLFTNAVAKARALPPSVEIFHEGRCARCGRLLTVPESVTTGYGPECLSKI